MLVALALAVASPLLISGQAWSAGLERASSALASLAQRSPGARTSGTLIKVKHARENALSPDQMVERALGKEFPPERVVPGTEDAFPSPDELLDAVEAPVAIAPPAAIAGLPANSTAAGPFIPPTLVRGLGDPGGGGGGGGGGGSGGSGGSGGGGPGDVGVTPNVVIPPAVPEPGTWATMILGMGLCAWSMRRRAALRVGLLCAAG